MLLNSSVLIFLPSPSSIWSTSFACTSWRLILTWFSPDVYSVYSLWCLFYLSVLPFSVPGAWVGSSKTVRWVLLSCHTEVAVGIQFKGSMAWIYSVVILGKVLKVWNDGSVLGFMNLCLFMWSVIKWGGSSQWRITSNHWLCCWLKIVLPKKWLL